MIEKKIIYNDKYSNTKEKLSLTGYGLLLTIAGLFIILYTILYPHNLKNILLYALPIFGMFFIMFGILFFVAVLTSSHLKIFNLGVALPEKTFMQGLLFKDNYIPFSIIKKIELGDAMGFITITTNDNVKLIISRNSISNYQKVKHTLLELVPNLVIKNETSISIPERFRKIIPDCTEKS